MFSFVSWRVTICGLIVLIRCVSLGVLLVRPLKFSWMIMKLGGGLFWGPGFGCMSPDMRRRALTKGWGPPIKNTVDGGRV